MSSPSVFGVATPSSAPVAVVSSSCTNLSAAGPSRIIQSQNTVNVPMAGRAAPSSAAIAVMNAFSTTSSQQQQQSLNCCLVENDRRCTKAASSHQYSKRFEKLAHEKQLKVYVDPNSQHTNVCAAHRKLISPSKMSRPKRHFVTPPPPQTTSTSSNSYHQLHQSTAEKKSTPIASSYLDQNGEAAMMSRLSTLPASSLRRYKKFFKLSAKNALNKQQMAEAVWEHLKTVPLNERDVLTYFIHAVKTRTSTVSA